MRALSTLEFYPLLDSFISLITAFVLGALIGMERQYRQRDAGLRTNVLVAVGAAAFVDIGMRLTGQAGGAHVLAYVVSGVGFLGAGVIMKQGVNIRGINTAATLWGCAAVGAAAGADFIAEAVMVALVVLLANTALRPVVNAINRQPLNEVSTEATYELHVTVIPDAVSQVREAVATALEKRNYAVHSSDVAELSGNVMELAIVLSASTANPDDMDAIVAEVTGKNGVRHAAWSIRTSD